MKFWHLAAFATVFLFAGSAVAGGEDDRKMINATYVSWVEATNAKDIEAWQRFLAPDPLFMPPDIEPLRTREAIIDFYRALFADPNFTIGCEQVDVEVAAAGDMAWSNGRCEVTFTGADGEAGSARSKWAKVWVKGEDGRWRARLNTWNAVPE